MVGKFKKDETAFDQLAGHAAMIPARYAVHRRYLFHVRVNKQYRAAFVELGYTPHPDIIEVVGTKSTICAQTQIVEDINGIQSACGRSTSGTRFRKASGIMTTVLQKKTTPERHQPLPVPMQATPKFGQELKDT